jgi:rare lipoprotein A
VSAEFYTESGIASIWETTQSDTTAWPEHPVAYPTEYVAAHKTLPLGTFVKVQREFFAPSGYPAASDPVIVQIVDRGPYVEGRIIDLMKAPANAIGITDEMGIDNVTIEVVPAPGEA